jgi:peroxiredoxin
MPRLSPGDVVRRHELIGIRGEHVQVPDAGCLVHLQFRRYAACPVCNLHLRSFARRHSEIVAAGIREVVVFHSKRELMLEFQAALPFAAIADPERLLYREFEVGTMSPWLVFHPRSWRAAARGVTQAPSLRGAMGKGEDHMGHPADFLVGSGGKVLAVNYGEFIDDHWSVDDLLEMAARGEVIASRSEDSKASSPARTPTGQPGG